MSPDYPRWSTTHSGTRRNGAVLPTSINPAALTKQHLFSAVDALQPAIAVFDCDGTLWSGDAGSSFMWWSMETGLLTHEKTSWLKARYDGYKRGEVSEVGICGEMVQVYAGIDEAALRKAATSFFREHIEAKIFAEMHELITTLQQRGVAIWAVSSTNHWVIEEGVSRFQIPADRILAARVAVERDVITDRLLDVPTDEGKVTALGKAGITQPDAVFGNSVHDAAMLSIARQAFPVNPTPALAACSAENGWPVFYPANADQTPSKHP